MAYKAIDSYGIIGDLHSAALVNMDGSIDWCCLPRFDSPSVFAAILDEKKGGSFKIAAKGDCRLKQMYLPDTNVLVTRFLSAEGVGEVVDFMPMDDGEEPPHAVIRIARCVRGSIQFQLSCLPAFDYARARHTVKVTSQKAVFSTKDLHLILTSSLKLPKRHTSAIKFDFTLAENETASFVLQASTNKSTSLAGKNVDAYAQEALNQTIAKWKKWVAKCTYQGRWREMVIRSALTLKVLTYEPTGALVAAPTCSLPEEIGGIRNWDYRYTWIRDSAFAMYALLRIGYTEEAAKFINWLQSRASEDQDVGPLQVMYRIDGSPELDESILDHLEGYQQSKPVRIGNEASNQLQLDIYGELIDAIYLFNKHSELISYDVWNYVQKLVYWVCDNWKRPDHSIWEMRRKPEHFVYSKMQCWVALDRGMRIAQKRNLPLDFDRVRKESNVIYETIMQKGWCESCQSFVQYFGSEAVDATCLLFPLMLFVSSKDPRMTTTLDRVMKEIVSDSLVYRYELGKAVGDGLPGIEGTFSVCTFWLVEVLARAGRADEARFIFEKMLTYANHLGLYAEEIGPTGESLGNFPQAFTHLGLIAAALDLDHQLNRR